MAQPLVSSTKLSVSSISTDIYPLITPLYPNWSPSNTHLQQLTGGINNTTFGLFDNSNPSEALVIKIYGSKTEEFIDRNVEIDTLCFLSKHQLAQSVLVHFGNGIIYKYAQGEICTRDDIRNINLIPLIARHMAKLHSIPIDNQNEPCLIPLMRKFLLLIDSSNNQPEDFHSLSSEVDWIEHDALPKMIPHPQYGIDLVLCHNDIVCNNILYNSLTHSVSFIDFEYCSINYALFDIANHFVEYAGVDQIDFDRYPNRNEQYYWLKFYFQQRNLLFNEGKDKICHLIDQFSALCHLCFGLWALAQFCFSKHDSDYEIYGRRRINRYKELKKKLFN